MIDPEEAFLELQQESQDAVIASERAEEIRDTPLGEWYDSQGELPDA